MNNKEDLKTLVDLAEFLRDSVIELTRTGKLEKSDFAAFFDTTIEDGADDIN